ncbi:hypothetical protein [Vreelandella populi]|uniref:Uncharacterized protein n=1 Tax=Vreelandella populi TaxID=2498858 RepID=A0A433L8B4_9GAMM|nr:hypothetical protein [Halomonas populi]RUR43606.1 hypothetical protein ELY37_18155 [Halomonas populi]
MIYGAYGYTGELVVQEAVRHEQWPVNLALKPPVSVWITGADHPAQLKAALPDASHLALGFDSRSGFSLGYRENLSRKLIKACIAKTVKGLDKSARANTMKLVLFVENRIGCYSRIYFKFA